MESDFEEIDHTADWAIRVRGRSYADLLVHAAQAVIQLTGARMAAGPIHWRHASLSANDGESLLVLWLEDLLHSMESRKVGCDQISVEVTPEWHLEGRVREVPLLAIERPIKAVTFHELAIQQKPGGFETTIVFDV